jgi:phospholipid transport system substrate-binding protein
MTLNRLLATGLIIGLMAVVPTVAAAKTSPEVAQQFIQKLGDEAVKVLSDKSIPLSQREAQIREILRRNFDLETIGRFVLSRHWRTATPDEKSEYMSLFSEYVLRTYARRLGAYGNETFQITSSKPLGSRDAIVLTKITTQAGGQPITAGWRVRDRNDSYKIIDVMVEGVSMAAAQRSEFESVIQKQGLNGLIEILRAKVSAFPARPS